MKREERAQQAWLVLVSAAHNRQIVTYEDLASHIGMGAGTLAGPLGCIMHYCDQSGLPPLTSLVVRKKGGRPGSGLSKVRPADIDAKRQEVFRYRWFKRLPPSAEEFAIAFSNG